MVHICSVIYQEASLLSLCLGLRNPALGRAGWKWAGTFQTFFPSDSVCILAGTHQTCSNALPSLDPLLDKGSHALHRVKQRRTFPQLSGSLWQKEESWQSVCSIPPKKCQWDLWGHFGKMFWGKIGGMQRNCNEYELRSNQDLYKLLWTVFLSG